MVAEAWLPLYWSTARFDWKSGSGAAALQKRSGCAERKKKGGALPGKNERDATSAKGRRYKIRKIEEAREKKGAQAGKPVPQTAIGIKKDRQECLSQKLEMDFG